MNCDVHCTRRYMIYPYFYCLTQPPPGVLVPIMEMVALCLVKKNYLSSVSLHQKLYFQNVDKDIVL